MPRLSKSKERRLCKQLGARLRAIRRARGFTTTTLGMAVGLSQAQISRLEIGSQGLRSPVLMRLASILEVSPAVFFVDEKDVGRLLKKASPHNEIKGLKVPARKK